MLHGTTTLMSQLRVKNTKFAHALRNALMDHHLIERCVLVDSEREGLQLLRSYERAHVVAWVQCRDGGKCTRRGKNTVRGLLFFDVVAVLCNQMHTHTQTYVPPSRGRFEVKLVKSIDQALQTLDQDRQVR